MLDLSFFLSSIIKCLIKVKLFKRIILMRFKNYLVYSRLSYTKENSVVILAKNSRFGETKTIFHKTISTKMWKIHDQSATFFQLCHPVMRKTSQCEVVTPHFVTRCKDFTILTWQSWEVTMKRHFTSRVIIRVSSYIF